MQYRIQPWYLVSNECVLITVRVVFVYWDDIIKSVYPRPGRKREELSWRQREYWVGAAEVTIMGVTLETSNLNTS